MIPKDPVILLSFLNMKLRDEYSTLDDLCASLELDRQELEETMNAAGFVYNPSANQFR